MNPLFLWKFLVHDCNRRPKTWWINPLCFQMDSCSFQQILSSLFSKCNYFNCCQFEGSTPCFQNSSSSSRCLRTSGAEFCEDTGQLNSWTVTSSNTHSRYFSQSFRPYLHLHWHCELSLVTFWSVYSVFSCFVALLLIYTLVFEVCIIWPFPKDDGKQALTLKGYLGCQRQKCCPEVPH